MPGDEAGILHGQMQAQGHISSAEMEGERSLGPWGHYRAATAIPSCLHPDFLIM